MANGRGTYHVKRQTQGATGTNTINIYNKVEFGYGADTDLDEILPWETDVDTESGHPLMIEAKVDTDLPDNAPPWKTDFYVPPTAFEPRGFETKVHVPAPEVLPVVQAKVEIQEESENPRKL